MARGGDWIASETCARVQRMFIFPRKCWRFIPNRLCVREFKVFGNAGPFRWKPVTRSPAGRKEATTWTTSSIRRCAGTSAQRLIEDVVQVVASLLQAGDRV